MGMTKRAWELSEEHKLRRDADLKPAADIARDLRRTPKSVESKIARMKGKPRIEFERNQLANVEMLLVKHEERDIQER